MRARAIFSAAIVLLFFVAVVQGEIRTWKAAAGGFTVDAEFVEVKPGDVVRLRTKDGRELNVPIAQLSVEDQAYLRSKLSSTPLGKTQRAADLCRLPDDAIVIYKVFHDDPKTSPADRTAAAAKIAELKDLAAKKMVRLNKKWVTAAEAEAVRKKADELMRQGLELMKIGQEDAFRRKFGEAATLEPESIRADFLTGLIYTLILRSEKALPYFQKCLLVDPDNIAALNNAALSAAGKGDWNVAAVSWRKALALQPDQRVVHNVGRFLEQSLRANVSVPKSARDTLALPYAELVASGKFESTDDTVGWLLLLIEESDLDLNFGKDGKDQNRPDPRPPATEDGPVTGGGTGFVVHSGYVLTNAHVATDDATYEIQLPDNRLLKTTRVAVDPQLDLALLKCEELAAPPLRLAPYAVPRGTDVMLLGFPEMFNLGPSLKSTRGSISSIPDPQFKNHYLYDAVTNSGNSGGPVCDDKANVIAVHAVGVNTASRYGGGIPSAQALAFLQKSLPDFKPEVPHDAALDWPEVDEKVAPSTVLIWVRKKNGKPTTAMGADVVEVPICLFCGGARQLLCGNCRGGTTRDGSDCPSCHYGKVNCSVCKGEGIDATLASVKANRSGRPKSTPVTTNTPTNPPAPNGTKSAVQFFGEAPGLKGLGYDMRQRINPTRRMDDAEIARHVASLLQADSAAAAAAARSLAEAVPNPKFRPQVAAALERWVKSDANWIAHGSCIRALEVWTGPKSVAVIAVSAKNHSWIIRHQVAYALAYIGDPNALPTLVYRLRKPEDVENNVPGASGERGLIKTALILFGPAAKPEIEKLRNDGDAAVRAAAEEILKAYDGQQPGPAAPPQNAVSVDAVPAAR